MRIAGNNTHGNKNWPKLNKCVECKHYTPFTTDWCSMVGSKPRQKCPIFKAKD